MQIKKSGNRIFGASLTAAEKRAMEIEIKRQLAEYSRENAIDICAAVMWTLHTQFGFGHDRLMRFYNGFMPVMNDLVNHYELETEDADWLCAEKLKDIGVDLYALENGGD